MTTKQCAVFLLFVALASCSSTTGSERRRPGSPAAETVSPLGVEYPNPLVIISRVAGNMEAGDWEAACLDLCDLGRNGRPVPLVPGKNVPKDFPSTAKEQMKPYFQHLRGLEQPWVKIAYGSVKPLLNDPPTIAVPVRWRYLFDRITAKQREVILHVWRKQARPDLSWEELVSDLRRQVAQRQRLNNWPEWTFAWIGNRWRLYIDPRPLR